MSSAEAYTRLDWAHPTTTWLHGLHFCMGIVCLPLLPLMHPYSPPLGRRELQHARLIVVIPRLPEKFGRATGVAVLSLCSFPYTAGICFVSSRLLFRANSLYQKSRVQDIHHGRTSASTISPTSCPEATEPKQQAVPLHKGSNSRTTSNGQCKEHQASSRLPRACHPSQLSARLSFQSNGAPTGSRSSPSSTSSQLASCKGTYPNWKTIL